MSQSAQATRPKVSAEEIARRIAEYRRMSYERRAPAMMIYQPPQGTCPWAGCTTRISGFRLNLEQIGSPDDVERWMKEWWQGPGLVGKCPGCGRYVLYGYEVKHAVAEPSAYAAALLPDNWATESHVSPSTGQIENRYR